MSQRKSTPSLMDDLLSGKKRQQDSKPESQQSEPTPPPEDSVPSEEKKKATFYILEHVLHDLDEAQLHLRRLADSSQRGQISKSAIVEAALQITIEELAERPEDSELARRLIQY